MKLSKNGNEMVSRIQATPKYTFVAPGVVVKGRGRGLRSMPNTQGMQTKNQNHLVLEKGNIPSFSSIDEAMQYIQTNSASAQGKGQGLRSLCSFEESEDEERSFHQNAHNSSQSMSRSSKSIRSATTLSAAQGLRTMNRNSLIHKKENIQIDIPVSLSTDDVMKSPQIVETNSQGKGRGLRSMYSFEESENEQRSFHPNAHYASQSMSRPSKSTISDSTMYVSQGLRTTNKHHLVHEKEHMQTDSPKAPTDQVKQSTHTVETSSCTTGKEKKVRGSNKCNEVALLKVGQKLKLTFYNNRTDGNNSNIFSRHLGRIVRDRNMCPLGVSSRDHIKEEKLNHTWEAVKIIG